MTVFARGDVAAFSFAFDRHVAVAHFLNFPDGAVDFDFVIGAVVALEPAAEAIDAGVDDALGDVGHVELVANFPFEAGGKDDAAGEAGSLPLEPLVDLHDGVGNEGEEGGLVDDAGVERGGLKEGDAVVTFAGDVGVELGEGGGVVVEHLGGEEEGAFFVEDAFEAVGEVVAAGNEINGEDHAVNTEVVEVFGGEVEGDVGRVGPVEEAGGEAVVLGDGEPVPGGVAGDLAGDGVFAEVAEEGIFEGGEASTEAEEAGAGREGVVGDAAEGEGGAKAAVGLVPGTVIEPFLQVGPAFDADLLH